MLPFKLFYVCAFRVSFKTFILFAVYHITSFHFFFFLRFLLSTVLSLFSYLSLSWMSYSLEARLDIFSFTFWTIRAMCHRDGAFSTVSIWTFLTNETDRATSTQTHICLSLQSIFKLCLSFPSPRFRNLGRQLHTVETRGPKLSRACRILLEIPSLEFFCYNI